MNSTPVAGGAMVKTRCWYHLEQFLRALPMEHTVQNTEGTEVPPQTQRFQTIRENGIIDNPNGPLLYGVKWK
ncbi:hypothetical protein A7M49_19630 [Acinetobacter baumannii]|nr:hypothetical protein A7M49_19630 [Acinetobacter baumannii]